MTMPNLKDLRLVFAFEAAIGYAGIDGSIYNDAHANWSIAISRVSSRNEKT